MEEEGARGAELLSTSGADRHPVVRVDADGGVLVVTIDRPERRNAVDEAVAFGIAAAMELLDRDPELRVGLLTGAGGTFCSGMDFRAFAEGRPARVPGAGFAGLVERRPGKTLVAAVEGHATGGGFEIALACDLVVAARDACFSLPEVRRGLIPGSGGLFRLPRQVPRQVAARMILTGEPVDGAEAERLGLVCEATQPGEALLRALELAHRIAANAPLAVDAAVAMLRTAVDDPDAEAFERVRPVLRAVSGSADAQEGTRAFLERREPRWLGR